MPWSPILKDSLAFKAERKISEIKSFLSKTNSGIQNNGLMTGKSGLALFFSYYHLCFNDQKEKNKALELISEVFDSINNGFSYHTFAGGLAGISATVEHLIEIGILDNQEKEVLNALDSYLVQTMAKDMEMGNYDFLHGAMGNAIYLLKRSDIKEIKQALSEIVDLLDKKKQQESGDYYSWLTDLNETGSLKGCNLGLSHGQASIIRILTLFYKFDINPKKTLKLIHGAVKYLLKHRLDSNHFSSVFPNWITNDEPLMSSRLAWCYGDLGIGISLWLTARDIDDIFLERKAVQILIHASKRRDLKKNLVNDAGICHGVAGIAHIFNRIYQYTGIADFKETAIYWYETLLKFDKVDDAYASFKVYQKVKSKNLESNTTLIEGIAGIGLVLMSGISEKEPAWDNLFLLS